MIGLIVSAIGFTMIGAAVARLTGGAARFLMGLGIVGTVLYVAMLFGLDPRQVLMALSVAALLVLMLKRREKQQPDRKPHSKTALAVLLLPIALALFIAGVTPLRDYDGRAFWMLKAKAIATERAIDGAFFKEEVVHSPRNQYPLLIPIDAAAAMIAAGEADERHARWIYIFALASFALHARRFAGDWVAALIPWIPQFAVWPDGSMLSAYNDGIVAAFVACALFELVERGSPLRLGLWLSFLVLAKNEGLPLALILFIAGIAVFRARVVVSFAPLIVAVTALFIWRSRVVSTDEQPFTDLLQNLPSQLHRAGPALVRFGQHAFDFKQWGLFWVVAIVAAAILIWRREWRAMALPAFVVLATVALYVAAYIVTSWKLNDLIDSSANRLLMHIAGPAVYVIGACVRSR